ncbi:extracellular solute-binding protein, partial [Nonomuraea sp. NPDC000554]|uniref:ABC transporter substrate-binding protein n=1 Tax=Nonomuraea sp. NPDC000554 TaxID=3154259 RepID=UPI00333094A3
QSEIRMLANITPNLTKAFWQGLVKPFENAHPGVKVKIEGGATPVKQALPQLLAAGNAPDVVETLSADKTLAPQMLDLTDQPWVKDTPLAEQAKVDGRSYSVGVGVQAQSLVFYNKEAFTKAGITKTPTSIDEFEAAMAKLKDAGYLPLQTAGAWVTGAQVAQFSDPSVFGASPNWYQDVLDNKTSPGKTYTPILERYAQWIAKGYIDKNALGLDDKTAPANFFAGKSAMYVMGSWFVATADAAKPPFPVGVFSAPTTNGQAYPGPVGVSVAAPYMVLKDTKVRDLSVELVKYLVTDKQAIQKQLRQDGNFRQGYPEGLSALGADVQAVLDAAPSQVPHVEGLGSVRTPAGFGTEWNKQVQGLYTGKSVADVAAGIDSWMAAQK